MQDGARMEDSSCTSKLLFCLLLKCQDGMVCAIWGGLKLCQRKDSARAKRTWWELCQLACSGASGIIVLVSCHLTLDTVFCLRSLKNLCSLGFSKCSERGEQPGWVLWNCRFGWGEALSVQVFMPRGIREEMCLSHLPFD